MLNHIVVVGAGPIGLLLTWHLNRIYNSRVRIHLLEKRPDYTRRQMILLDRATLKFLPKESRDELFGLEEGKPGCGRILPAIDSYSRCYKDVFGNKELSGSIRISELEKSLYKLVSKLKNVTILAPINNINYKYKNNCHLLEVTMPNGSKHTITADIIIGSDGSGSHVRQYILKAQFNHSRFVKEPSSPIYGAVFNFDNIPKKEGVYPHLVGSGTRRRPQHLFRHFRGRGIYYIALIVSKSEADQIKQGVMPLKIKTRLAEVCRSVTPVGKSCSFSNLSQMGAFQIKPSTSSKFSNDRRVYLVGDSAISTHYFSASGFNTGVASVQQLLSLFRKHPTGNIPPKEYRKMMIRMAKRNAQLIKVRTGYPLF